MPLAKYAATVRRRTICTCCGRVHAWVFVHALVELNGSDIDAVFLTFSLELSGECHTQDDWHASLKIAVTEVNFKLYSRGDWNVISQSLFDRLPVLQKQAC